MKRIYSAVLLACTLTVAQAQQMDYRLLSGDGMMLVDVNNSGKALHNNGYYDYATNTHSGAEADVKATHKINKQGDVAGTMVYTTTGGDNIDQAAYRKGGIWTAIGFFPGDVPGNSWFGAANSISGDSKYVTGQITTSVNNSFPFVYDTTNNSLRKLTDGSDKWLYGRGEAINNQGVVAGFVDREDFHNTGTFWVPAYFDAAGTLHYINLDEANATTGEASGINNSGQIVGYQAGKPFIYNVTTHEFKSFNPPAGYDYAVFTSISDNGVAIGYAGYYPEREAIIYHPSLGNAPILLKNILEANGVDIATPDDMLGTAMGISEDGNWVAGFDNIQGPPVLADGWIVNMKNKLISTNDCHFECPADVVVNLTNPSQNGVVVNYTLPIVCGTSSSANLHVELVTGLESGQSFPVGKTTVMHKLVDAQGNIVNICSFVVTVNDIYCTMEPQGDFNGITKVKFAGIDNTTSAFPTSNGQYTNQVANVEQTKTYPFTLEGNTWGGDNFVTVFIDWNQNGVLDDTGERFNLGTINSNGTDGVQLVKDIVVPADAKVGKARMRVVLNDGAYVAGPCNNANFFYGQIQDYTVDVKQFLGTSDLNAKAFQYYPNPVKDILTVSSTKKINALNIHAVDGKMVNTTKLNATKSEINLSGLAAGVYVATATFEDGTSKTFKVVKQ